MWLRVSENIWKTVIMDKEIILIEENTSNRYIKEIILLIDGIEEGRMLWKDEDSIEDSVDYMINKTL